MRLISVMVWVLALVMSGPASSENRPVSLELVSPPQLKNDGLMLSRHWALTLRLEIRDVEYLAGVLGGLGLVYDDPDGFPSFDCAIPECAPVDESWVTFRPDYNDSAGVKDTSHCEGMTDDVFDEWAIESLNKPYLFATPLSEIIGSPDLIPVGQDTGEQVADCFGYGRDDDIPGLVVIADVGGARIFDAQFNTLAGRVRNLAGFVSQLSLEVLDSKSRAGITATIAVDDLFQPIMVVDLSVGGQPGLAFQEDGSSPVFPVLPDSLWKRVSEVRVVTVRSVVVEGNAPDFIDDMDGDGEYTANDLSLAGYTLLSNEVQMELATREWVSSLVAFEGDCRLEHANFIYVADLDGDGSLGEFECGVATGRGSIRIRR